MGAGWSIFCVYQEKGLEMTQRLPYNRSCSIPYMTIGGVPMLFTKKIEPRCAYCQRGTPIHETQVLCLKKGVVSLDDACRHFRYDPLKRIPPRPPSPDFSRLKDEDFIL